MKKKMLEKTTGILTMEKADNRPLNSVGSSRIRARWPLHYWPEAEEYVIGKKYSVLVFQKVYWENMLKNFEGIKILDLCDPDWLEGKPVFEFIDMVDAVTTSTEALAEYIRKLRPDAFVKCIPDRVYIPECQPVKKVHEGKLKKLVWFGYHHNTHYLTKTFDDLVKNNIELTIIAENPFNPQLTYRNRLKLKNVPWNYGTIFREIVKNDAVLMPNPEGDERARYKSNNKPIQAKAQGMPVVVSPDDLKRFMNPEERRKESRRGLKEVKEKWDCRLSVGEYREVIKQIEKKGN